MQGQLSDLKNSLVIYSKGATATEAVEAFSAGFNQLGNATIDPAQQQAIVNYYNTVFAKEEDAQTGEQVDVNAILPTSNAQKYLQANYTAPYPDWNQAIKVDDARDGSAWSAANARYNDFFRQIVNRFAFEDALLLDTAGNVIYSAYKGVDLGTNILTGPYKSRRARRRPTRRRWRPTTSTTSASPTSATTSPPTNRPHGWCLRSAPRAGPRACSRCSSRSPRSTI